MRQLKISKQITNRDSTSFSKYLKEVNRLCNTITQEEEIELTKKIKKGDIDARNKLCEANLRFVISVAKQYNTESPIQDLVNEGNFGLIKAAEKFDETKGFKFISYAVWWIRQSIMQYLNENEKQIKLPANKIGMLNKINKIKSELEQVYQRQPTNEEIADYLIIQEENKGIDGDIKKYEKEKINEIVFNSSKLSYLDAPLNSEEDAGSLLDFIPGDNEHDIKNTIKHKDLQIELKRVFNTLKKREVNVLILYFGLFDTPQMSLEEIGDKFDLTRERTRQIKESGIRKLKFRVSKTNLREYI